MMTAWMTAPAVPLAGSRPAPTVLIDMEAAGGVDLDRLERALELASVGQVMARMRERLAAARAAMAAAAQPAKRAA